MKEIYKEKRKRDVKERSNILFEIERKRHMKHTEMKIGREKKNVKKMSRTRRRGQGQVEK